MYSRAKLISIWVAAGFSTVAAGYAFVTAGTLAALSAFGSWSHEYATLWIWAAFLLSCLFGVEARIIIVRLLRYYEQLPRLSGDEDRSNP
jgi:ABC-type multidrug transport system permease subunit